MTKVGFGQDVGRIIQTAYVVKDIRAAIHWWIDSATTGPWFLLDHFLADDHVYRGQKSQADLAIELLAKRVADVAAQAR